MDLPPELKDALPGAGGSLTALLFFRRGWPMAIALFICGIIAAWYLGSWVAHAMSASREIAGYVTGLFAMAIVAKLFDIIATFEGKEMWGALWSYLLKKLGSK